MADPHTSPTGTLRIGPWHVEHWPTLDSTQTRLEQLLDATAADRQVVLADRQSAGQGRRGNPWQSPAGGLWFSFGILRPGPPDPFLGLLVMGAIRDALAGALGDRPPLAIKWPNDLVIGARKCGGMLLKMVTGASTGLDTAQHRVACGAGVNLDIPQADLAAITPPATSLAREFGQCPSPLAALSLILPATDRWLADDARSGRAHTVARLTPWINTLGKQIQWQRSDATADAPLRARGEALAIALDGALRVRTDDGQEILLRSEQVHHLTAGGAPPGAEPR